MVINDKVTDPVASLLSEDIVKKPEVPYWKKYQEGDRAAALPFLTEMDKTMDQAINQYAGGDKAYKTQARLLALQAAQTYDPHAGANIRTHVYNNLKRLQRISAQRGNLTRIPEQAAFQRNAVMKARKDYEIDHGEEPTVEELATMTGISRKRIDDLARYKPITPDSLTVSPEGDSLAPSREQRAMNMYDAYIYNDMDRIDKKIYEWSTGYGGSPVISQLEMAKKLGITPAAVSKRAKGIAVKFNTDRDVVRRAILNA